MSVQLEKREHVAIITMDRPEALNALNREMLNNLSEVLCNVKTDNDIRVAIITGAGKSFVAGADIGEMAQLNVEEAKAFCHLGHTVFSMIESMKKPFIAAINGYALGGGCELALACDIRLAGEKAKFAQPEVTLGITPGFGGTQRLPRVIGISNALELILTGKSMNAAEALDIGLVSKVYPQDELMQRALDLAESIAQNAPVAVYGAKQAIRRFTDAALIGDLDYEADMFSRCFATHDQKMAMKAFVNKEKRDEFKGV